MAPDEPALLKVAAAFLHKLEIRCLTMGPWKFCWSRDALLDGMPVDDLTTRARIGLRRSSELFVDVIDELRVQTLDEALRTPVDAY